MCNHLDRIPACNRRTDLLPRHSPRYAYASRGKNRTAFDKVMAKNRVACFFTHSADNAPHKIGLLLACFFVFVFDKYIKPTSDLILKVEFFVPFPCWSLTPTGIRAGSFVFRTSRSQVWYEYERTLRIQCLIQIVWPGGSIKYNVYHILMYFIMSSKGSTLLALNSPSKAAYTTTQND